MILAQVLHGPPPRYEFATLGPWVDQPSGALLAAGLAALVLAAVSLLYWRERASLSPLAIFPLLVLRVGAIIGVVLFGLAPEKRDAREQTQPSRVMVVVDNSLSMALPASTGETDSESREEAAVRLLEAGLLDALRAEHEVYVAPASDVRSGVTLAIRDPAAEPAEAALQGQFSETLAPRSSDSRLGDSIEQAMSLAAGGPLAGIVLVSDGQNNAGASPELVAAAAGDAGSPIATIGFGSTSKPRNLAVRDLMVPRRAYPQDEIQLTALVEQQGFDDARASVSLYVASLDAGEGSEQLLETRVIDSLSDSPDSIAFAARPEAPGRYRYRVAVDPLPGEQSVEDNLALAEVQVVDRLLRVLIIAGGPTRDYHYLRDQLRRDDAFTVEVWLQSSPGNAAQDADEVLAELPEDDESLADYDLFVALDADWTRASRQTIQAIERCVAQRGAGFLFASGPVHTPRWLRDADAQGVQALLPVRPAAAPLLLAPTERTSPTPDKILLTRAGQELAALWTAGNQAQSVAFWQDEFPGFYTTAQIEMVKPGAVVYAEASSAGDAAAESPRVVFAEQFFGAGRCFYVGAPEIWRLRTESPAAMRAFYTKLLQHLSQGRLLADSPAGSLLFERDRYSVGETLTLRATLAESTLADLPEPAELRAQVELPDGAVQTLRLAASESSPTVFSAGLRATREGSYQASLDVSAAAEPLTAKAQVQVPALERSKTRRDADMLQRIATESGGRYYPTAESALSGAGDLPPLTSLLVSRSETTILYGAPDEEFARKAAQWLLGVIAGCLLLEWACRRALGLA